MAEHLDAPFQLGEIINAIKTMYNGKAPGPDGFSIEFLKSIYGQMKTGRLFTAPAFILQAVLPSLACSSHPKERLSTAITSSFVSSCRQQQEILWVFCLPAEHHGGHRCALLPAPHSHFCFLPTSNGLHPLHLSQCRSWAFQVTRSNSQLFHFIHLRNVSQS